MFMASEVIAGLHLGQKSRPPPPFRHAIIHDLESFVWVLLYITVSTPDYNDARTFFLSAIRPRVCDEFQPDLSKFNFWTDTAYGWTRMADLLKSHPLWSTINSLHDAIDHCRELPLADRPGQYPALYDQFVEILMTAATSVKSTTNRKRLINPASDYETETEMRTKRFKTTVIHITPARKLRPRDEQLHYREPSGSDG